ncbi:hypothetical protein [Chitinimonas sp.]|uniref:hypothetical protein n=1 Tax=Chitinimonas sp. TaxID=1934313 RepID=UPI0035B31365
MLMRPLLCLLLTLSALAGTVEEARRPQAQAALPGIGSAFAELQSSFAQDWAKTEDSRAATALAQRYGRQLWQQARQRIHSQADFDDRPLYWARLGLSRTLREQSPAFPIFAADRQAAIAALEWASRGMDDIAFPDDAQRPAPARTGRSLPALRILLTGFDPFLLDRRISQSNPSGVNALLLDGAEFTVQAGGQPRRVHIETAMIPVRQADFDAGMIERLTLPWLSGHPIARQDRLDAGRSTAPALPAGRARPQIDMLVTVSMGRRDFDLERFPGRRRSSSAPDNDNVYSGGSLVAPILPNLGTQELSGAEFIEFSLPAKAMLTVQTPYAVHDNRWVRTLTEQRLAAGGLAALQGKTAVEGSGGGYFSNEISYRTLRLREQLGLGSLPIGHIHTPAMGEFDPATLKAITGQIRAMLEAAAADLAAKPRR